METGSKLHTTVTTSIISVIEEYLEHPEILGIDFDLLNRLRHLDSFGQKFISLRADQFLTLKIDPDELQIQLDSLQDEITSRALEDEYLLRQAPSRLMRELFGMHTTEFCLRRRYLNLSGTGQHRPPYCDKDTELLLWQHWKESEALSDRERYLTVAKQTNQPINVVWTAAKRYAETA
ncbi:MAG: STY4526/YPO1902 family pathogenicity island replication protein [Cellvibrionaceae bacterium]